MFLKYTHYNTDELKSWTESQRRYKERVTGVAVVKGAVSRFCGENMDMLLDLK